MRIIAYTYGADVHCPACTVTALRNGQLHIDNANPLKHVAGDEFGIPLNVVDREGNLIHPAFDIDEHGFTHCGDCHEELT